MQIRRLERQLEARLFERDRRHVKLTEAGAFLLERARHLLGEAERVRRDVQRIVQGQAGVLSIGYTPTAVYELLPRLIPRYVRSHPAR